MELFLSLKEDPAVDGDAMLELVEGLARCMEFDEGISHVLGPLALADRKAHLDRAEELVLEGAAKARKRNRQWDGPDTDSPGKSRRVRRYERAQRADARGWIRFQQGRLEEAQRQLAQATKLNPQGTEALFHPGRVFEAQGDLARAQEWYGKGIALQSPTENPSEGALKDLYVKQHGSAEGYEGFRARFEAKHAEERRARILAQRNSSPLPLAPFDLKALEGGRVQAASLKGKIVVINLWGIWCGWCVKEMPDFQKLHEHYRDDPEVAILTIDNDSDPEQVRGWMKKRGFDFPVLLDDGYVARVGVQAFPTTWFLDRKGRKAFVLESWTKQLVQEYSWRIETLKEDAR